MKIWVTRRTAGELIGGGLSRVQVWFEKPVFYYKIWPVGIDSPFGNDEGDISFREVGYRLFHGSFSNFVPFSTIFGYCDDANEHKEIARYVWGKVLAHFNNEPWEVWERLELDKVCRQENFILELNIEIKLYEDTDKKLL